MGKKIITSLYEFVTSGAFASNNPLPSPTPETPTRPKPPTKPVPPARPDDDRLERPSIDTRPLAVRKALRKMINGESIEEIGKTLAKNLIKRLESINNLPPLY